MTTIRLEERPLPALAARLPRLAWCQYAILRRGGFGRLEATRLSLALVASLWRWRWSRRGRVA